MLPSPPRADEESDRHLSWRFEGVDYGGTWGWLNLQSSDAKDLNAELVQFEREQIYVLKRRRWLKFIPMKDMRPGVEDRLREIGREDEGLWQLHLSRNKWRVWGFYEEPVFYILWWDSRHDVCTGRSRQRRSD